MNKFVKTGGRCTDCGQQGQVRRNPDWRPNDDWLCFQCYDEMAAAYGKLAKVYLENLKNPEFAKADALLLDDLDDCD